MIVRMHLKEGADPKDRTVMRINFDTLYSFAIVEPTEPYFNGEWVMPELELVRVARKFSSISKVHRSHVT